MIESITAIAMAISELIKEWKKMRKLRNEAIEKEWIDEGISISEAIENATTDEQRQALARKLFEHRKS